MKKVIMLLAVCAFGSANAQVSFKPGVKAGYISSTITGYGADYRNSFYLGAYGNLALGKVYNMQFELMYLRQGADNLAFVTTDYNQPNYPTIVRRTDVPLDYISLNLINKFNFDKFNLHIGPGLDVRVSEEKLPDYLVGDYYDSKPYSVDNEVDLTFNIGLGYNITDNFGIEVRMRQGIIEPIYANSSSYSSSSHLNRSYMVGATYTFK